MDEWENVMRIMDMEIDLKKHAHNMRLLLIKSYKKRLNCEKNGQEFCNEACVYKNCRFQLIKISLLLHSV